MNQAFALKVMALYAQIDQLTDTFLVTTQLHCPSGCGWCCTSPDVEATPLEMLPIAFELFRRGEGEVWIERTTREQEIKTCLFYQPNPLIPDQGRCQAYAMRPTICRLFGWSTATNKSGQPELIACTRHKALMPEVVACVAAAIANGLEAPNMAALSQQVANLDPELGRQRMPINQALRVALFRVGLELQLTGDSHARTAADSGQRPTALPITAISCTKRSNRSGVKD
ncbi:MAG TPA: YkgJ family cysteine cluster protein [Waterburya sp.]